MKRPLPGSASVANPLGGARLHAPSADRNAEPITRLLLEHAPRNGRALEIASGTGQHVVAYARALPEVDFHPTDVQADRLASIDAYAREAGLDNIAAARFLDATTQDWSQGEEPFDLVVLVNLLHLVSTPEAETIVREAVRALAPGGVLVIYGPFRRYGRLTSEGDVRFDAELRASDPDIGYKDDRQVEDWLRAGDLEIVEVEMPANNLAMIARRG